MPIRTKVPQLQLSEPKSVHMLQLLLDSNIVFKQWPEIKSNCVVSDFPFLKFHENTSNQVLTKARCKTSHRLEIGWGQRSIEPSDCDGWAIRILLLCDNSSPLTLILRLTLNRKRSLWLRLRLRHRYCLYWYLSSRLFLGIHHFHWNAKAEGCKTEEKDCRPYGRCHVWNFMKIGKSLNEILPEMNQEAITVKMWLTEFSKCNWISENWFWYSWPFLQFFSWIAKSRLNSPQVQAMSVWLCRLRTKIDKEMKVEEEDAKGRYS